MESSSSVEGRVGYELKRTQYALRARMDEGLRGIGLTTPQYAALVALGEEPGASGAGLARKCFVTPQTMNGILTNLESAGLVQRKQHPQHGRVLRAYLTEKGEEALPRAHRVVEAVEERMLAPLEQGERRELAEALRRCTESLKSDQVVSEGA